MPKGTLPPSRMAPWSFLWWHHICEGSWKPIGRLLPILGTICRKSVSSTPVSVAHSSFIFYFSISSSLAFTVASSLSFHLNPLISVSTAISVALLLLASSFLALSLFARCSRPLSLPFARPLRGSSVKWNPDRLTSDPQQEVRPIGL